MKKIINLLDEPIVIDGKVIEPCKEKVQVQFEVKEGIFDYIGNTPIYSRRRIPTLVYENNTNFNIEEDKIYVVSPEIAEQLKGYYNYCFYIYENNSLILLKF